MSSLRNENSEISRRHKFLHFKSLTNEYIRLFQDTVGSILLLCFSDNERITYKYCNHKSNYLHQLVYLAAVLLDELVFLGKQITLVLQSEGGLPPVLSPGQERALGPGPHGLLDDFDVVLRALNPALQLPGGRAHPLRVSPAVILPRERSRSHL